MKCVNDRLDRYTVHGVYTCNADVNFRFLDIAQH